MLKRPALLSATAAVVVGILSLPHPARAQRDQDVVYPPCREVRNLDALQYWFWDGYFGHVDVHDFTHERWGRLGLDPTICFRIALVVVDDVQLRTAGYRRAVTELLQWSEDALGDDDAERVARQLEKITGQDFDSREEWLAWWAESEPYVMWSPEEGHLVVVAEAQMAGEAAPEDALQLEPEEYWFYTGRGWIAEVEPVGEFVFGSLTIPPHEFDFRARAEELRDRGAKERGLRRALDNLFVDGLLLPDLPAARVDLLIARVRDLTGGEHDGREEWIAWWQQNRDRLVLSPGGDRLVVGR